MALSDINKQSNPHWLATTAEGVSSQSLGAAIESAGILKLASEAERLSYIGRNPGGPAAVRTQVPTPWIAVPAGTAGSYQLYAWQGTPPALEPIYTVPRAALPPALAALAQSDPAADHTLTRTQAAINYPGTVGKGQTHVAIQPGGGYARYVLETRQSGQIRRILVDPLKPTFEGGYLLFQLATPLEDNDRQSSLQVRGSLETDAVAAPLGSTGSGGGPAWLPPAVGAAGSVLRTNQAATAAYWGPLNPAAVFGSQIANPGAGVTLVTDATGQWITEAKATGVPTAGIRENYLLFGTATGGTQWGPNDVNAITGDWPLDRLGYSGAPVGSVPTIVDLGGGTHAPRWRTPTTAVADGTITPPKLNTGDATKQTGFRTAIGLPSSPSRAFVQILSPTSVGASAVFFPTDDVLRLYHSSTEQRSIETVAAGLEMKTGADNYLAFYRDSATVSRIASIGAAALQLQGQGLTVNAGTATFAVLGAGMSAGGNALLPGQALGTDATGAPAGISLYRAAPLVAHWTATVTCGSGASGAGYESMTGSTFGSLSDTDFVWAGTTYTVRQVIQDTSHAVKFVVKPTVLPADYRDWSFTLNGHLTLEMTDATVTGVARYGGVSTEFTWANQQPGVIPTTGTITVNLNRPATAQIPLPLGTTDQYMTPDAAGNLIWKDLPTGGGSPGQPGTPLTVTPRQEHITASRSNTSPLAEGTEYRLSLTGTSVAAPFSVASNRVNIAAGTTSRLGWIDWHLDVDPTAWVNSNTSGGNRLFLDVYWKKNGVIVEASRQATYIRGDEDWAPSDHVIHGSFACPLDASDYLEMFFVPTSANKSGAEIRGVQILNSDIAIATQTYTGGTGGTPGQAGATTYQALTNTESAVGAENQIEAWNAAGQLRHTNLGDLLGRISNPGRRVVWVKPSVGAGAQYSDTISTRAILPADYLSYDFIIWETASTSADYLAGTITDFRTWPTSILGSASKSNIDGSRVDWSAGNRTLSAGNTPDRFLRVVLVRGQGPPGPMGAAGTPGSGGANLATSGLPANLAAAAALGTAATAARADHVHAAALPDDSVYPRNLVADTAAQKQAFQTRIGEDESSSYIFWRSSITSGAGNGYSTLVGGTITDPTFDYLGTTYTVRQWESDGVGQFNINVNPAPSATLFNNLVAHFRGVTLRFRDASTTTATAFASPGRQAGRSWSWTGNHADLIPSNTTLPIALGEDVGTAIERVEGEVDNIRQAPAGGTPGQVATKTATGSAYQNLPALVRTPREANAIATIAQATVSDRTPRTIALASLSGDATAMGLTLSANAVRVTRTGLYHVAYDLDISIVGALQVHANLGNTNQRGSVAKLYPYPGQADAHLANQGTIAVKTAPATISLQWIALDIPALTSGIPPAPTAISIAAIAGSPGQFTIGWTFSGARVNTWTIEWRYTGETVWHSDRIIINRQSARQATLNTRHTSSTGVDVRVWGTNATGQGLYAQRNYGTTGTDGVFTRQTQHSQTAAAAGDLIIRTEDWSQ